MAEQNRDLGGYQKITGVQLERIGIRPKPVYINRAVFKKTDIEKINLANAKSSYKLNVRKDPERNRILQDQIANEMLRQGSPSWGAFKLNGHRLGVH
jgi:hypothetical protein